MRIAEEADDQPAKIAEEADEKPAKIAEQEPDVVLSVTGQTDHLLVTVGDATYDITRTGTAVPAGHVEQVRQAAARSRIPLR